MCNRVKQYGKVAPAFLFGRKCLNIALSIIYIDTDCLTLVMYLPTTLQAAEQE